MKPIKVLQVFTILNRGGAETNIMNYYRNIDRSSIQFDFLVHREDPGAYEKEIMELGGKIYRLPPVHPLHLQKYKAAVKKFFDRHPDYQIIHGQNSELGVFIYEEAKRRRIPVIIAHAHNAPKMSDYDVKFIFRELWKYRMRKSVNSFFTCGEDAAKWLFGEKRARTAFLMTNAVDTLNFSFSGEVRSAVRKRLGRADTKNIIHVGRFNRQKNHAFLLQIFAGLLEKDPAYHLFLVGEGELRREIEAQISQLNLQAHVTLMGLREDVNELLQAMDVFLFPSLFEGLPVSLVEAQASGIQCVISDGIPEEAILVPENVTVISLKEKAEVWAERILALDLSGRKDVSDIIIRKGYDIKENARKLENKYLDLLERSIKKPN